MSCESGSEGWHSENQTEKVLQSMRDNVYAKSQQEAQYMQQGMLVGDWATQRHEAMAWPPEPDCGRVATGVPNRVDRLKALGNAVVPQIPEIIGRAIMELESQR
jgi:hypothetical protein